MVRVDVVLIHTDHADEKLPRYGVPVRVKNSAWSRHRAQLSPVPVVQRDAGRFSVVFEAVELQAQRQPPGRSKADIQERKLLVEDHALESSGVSIRHALGVGFELRPSKGLMHSRQLQRPVPNAGPRCR